MHLFVYDIFTNYCFYVIIVEAQSFGGDIVGSNITMIQADVIKAYGVRKTIQTAAKLNKQGYVALLQEDIQLIKNAVPYNEDVYIGKRKVSNGNFKAGQISLQAYKTGKNIILAISFTNKAPASYMHRVISVAHGMIKYGNLTVMTTSKIEAASFESAKNKGKLVDVRWVTVDQI